MGFLRHRTWPCAHWRSDGRSDNRVSYKYLLLSMTSYSNHFFLSLMGQDEIYLQVISVTGEGAERKNAARVLKLLKKGKHWVLVTLLVSNVITNETLPIVLDRSLGGGYAAAISSTVLVSKYHVCSRHTASAL